MEKNVLEGQARESHGTYRARRMRQEGWVPANLYGHGEANHHFQVKQEDLARLIEEGHHMVTLQLGDVEDQGLLKEIQFDPLGEQILHVDFARVSMDEVVETLVPISTWGTAKGVSAGGILDVVHPEVQLRGKARDLPERLEIDISELQLGESISASELDLPAGVEALLALNEPIAIVHPPRGLEAEAAAEEGEEAAPTEPEVIGEKKEKEEE